MKIAVINRSTLVSDEHVRKYTEALQKQAIVFAQAWKLENPELTFVDSSFVGPLDPQIWQLVVLDDPDQAGVLGYHEQTDEGMPLGKVFARADSKSGSSVSATMSHELLEMLADPDAEEVKVGPNGWQYALEVCDPCEDDAFGYYIDGVLVSDFVLPSYFQQDGVAPFDQRNHIKQPFQLLSGGYQSYFDGQEWTQQKEYRLARWQTRPTEGTRKQRRISRPTT